MPYQRMHGHKRRFQLLIDPHRAELLEQLAQKEKLRATAFIRDRIYEAIKDLSTSDEYQEAAEADERIRADWIASLRRKPE